MSKFEALVQEGTNGSSYGIATREIVETFERWDADYGVEVSHVAHDRVRLNFRRLPADLRQLAEEIYGLCPDIIGQRSACIDDMVDELEKRIGAVFTEEVDLEDEELGLQLLEQILRSKHRIALWWSSMQAAPATAVPAAAWACR